jgi:1-acyl-sn-glycerol-3-phosphate acyltransferase
VSPFDYPHALWKPYSFVAMIVVVLSVMAWTPVVILCSFFGKRQHVTATLRSWNKFVLKIFRLKVHSKIDPSYDPQKASLLVCNHQSNFDIPVIYEALSGNIRMVAKKELFKIPFFGHCMRACEFVPIDRSSRSAGRKAAQKIQSMLESGLQIWLAPEGTRSKTGKLQDFKSGSFAVAIDSQIPIQPLVVKNAFKVMRPGDFLVRTGLTIDFEVLPQIQTQGLVLDDRRELAHKTRQAILQSLESPTELASGDAGQ